MRRREGPRAACFGAVRWSSVLRMMPAPVGEEGIPEPADVAAAHVGSPGGAGAGAGVGGFGAGAGAGGGADEREEPRNRHIIYAAMVRRAFSFFTR